MLNSSHESLWSAIIYTYLRKPSNVGFESLVNKHTCLINYLEVLYVNALLLLEMSLLLFQFLLHGVCLMVFYLLYYHVESI